MPRNISFSMTTDQVRNQTKTVTRRLGWYKLKAGDILNACVKCMGLKKGEKVEKICQIKVTDKRYEALHKISRQDVIDEGFPDMMPHEFVDFFCKGHKCNNLTIVTRIEFEYIKPC